MATDDDGAGGITEPQSSELQRVRALARDAPRPEPDERGPLARALDRLRRADPRHPQGLAYYDDDAG